MKGKNHHMFEGHWEHGVPDGVGTETTATEKRSGVWKKGKLIEISEELQLSGYLNIPGVFSIMDTSNGSTLLYTPAADTEITVISSVQEVSGEMEFKKLMVEGLEAEESIGVMSALENPIIKDPIEIESQRKFAKNKVDFRNEEIVKCLLDLSVLEGNSMFSKVISTLKSLPAFDYNWGAENYSDNTFNANWIYFDKYVFFKGETDNGIPQGKGIIVENGNIYQGHWEKGEKTGFGREITKNGRVLEGYWENDNKICE